MLARGIIVWLAVVSVCCEAGAAELLERYEFAQPHMGVPFQLIFYAEEERIASRAAKAAFARIKQLDRRLSDYDPQSELSQLNRTAGQGQAVPISDDLWAVLEHGEQLARQSSGAFDVTVGPYVKLWRRARRLHLLPSAQQIEKAKSAVGYARLQLDARQQTAHLTVRGMRLDLGGIAKGYAADEALRALKAEGVAHALVDAGGDIVLGDPPPDKPGWRIGVAPLEAGATPKRFYLLSRMAVATSGDAFQYVEIDGRRYSHLVDPRTGFGLIMRSSVTVFAPCGMAADALASAVSVLGPERGLPLIEATCRAAAIIVQAEDGRTKEIESRRVGQLKRQLKLDAAKPSLPLDVQRERVGGSGELLE